MSLTKCTPTLIVEWTYKHGAKDELILSCTENIGPNDECKLSSLCVFCAAICVRAQLSMNLSLGPSMFRACSYIFKGLRDQCSLV